jgi:hypothetical protein
MNIERYLPLLLVFPISITVSCSDMDAENGNIEGCEAYPCYKNGQCYEVVGAKYDLKNGCYEGSQEVRCLDGIDLFGLADTTYYLMGTGDNKDDCWLFGRALPKGEGWTTDITPLCYNVQLYIKEECTAR